MILAARISTIAIGLLLAGAATYLIWFVWSFVTLGKVLVYLVTLYLSVIVAAGCGEQILRRLIKHPRGDRPTRQSPEGSSDE